MPDTYVGLDFGGTKLLIGETDTFGAVIHTKKYHSGYMDQRRALDFITESLDDYLENAVAGKPAAIGLGLIGRVDNRRGLWFEMDRERKQAISIGEILQKRYRLPCYADNDVRSAAKAELRFGHGRDSRDFVYINFGTGIAAGIVTDGHIIYGNSFNAGEVGHTSAGIDAGTACACGRNNCVETIACGRGLDACARLYASRFPHTLLEIPEDKPVSARDIFDRADTDELCALLVSQAAEAAANLIMNLVRMSDPDTVVLGGGVVLDGFMLSRIKENLNAHTMRFVHNGVLLSALDPAHAGLIGACTVAMN